MEARPRTLRFYQTVAGTYPFRDWLEKYDRQQAGGIFQARLRRVENGNLGNCRSVGDGVLELKIDFGPGYRIYFGLDGDRVILLWGGTKSTRRGDIRTAKQYWRDYNA